MNSMLKNVWLAAGLAAAALTGVYAADNPPPAAAGDTGAAPAAQNPPAWRGGGAQHRLQRMTEALDLTPAQQEQFTAIFAAMAQQRQAIMNEPLAEADRRAKLHALMTDTHSKFRALLTPDQQQKFDAMPMRGGHEGPKGGEGAGGPPPAATP